MPILVALGNPLLDITAYADKELLDKYDLAENGAVLIDEQNGQKLLPIFNDVLKLDRVAFLQGGSALNTIRVFQWMLNKIGRDKQENRAIFFGAIGDDHYAERLIDKTMETGVDVRFQRVPRVETGKCVSLITGINRSLCAHLGAANLFTLDHLQLAENAKVVRSAQNFYTAAFFLTVCPEAVLHLAREAAKRDRPFALNLSAEYIPCKYKEELGVVLPFVDILFGNDSEAVAYSKANELNMEDDIGKIALELTRIEKINKKRSRIVIITRGGQPVIVAKDEQILEFSVPTVPESEFVDTNGAGDAFCGGFLAAFVSGRSLDECIRCAFFAAGTIVRHPGCTFPKNCEYSD